MITWIWKVTVDRQDYEVRYEYWMLANPKQIYKYKSGTGSLVEQSLVVL